MQIKAHYVQIQYLKMVNSHVQNVLFFLCPNIGTYLNTCYECTYNRVTKELSCYCPKPNEPARAPKTSIIADCDYIVNDNGVLECSCTAKNADLDNI